MTDLNYVALPLGKGRRLGSALKTKGDKREAKCCEPTDEEHDDGFVGMGIRSGMRDSKHRTPLSRLVATLTLSSELCFSYAVSLLVVWYSPFALNRAEVPAPALSLLYAVPAGYGIRYITSISACFGIRSHFVPSLSFSPPDSLVRGPEQPSVLFQGPGPMFLLHVSDPSIDRNTSPSPLIRLASQVASRYEKRAIPLSVVKLRIPRPLSRRLYRPKRRKPVPAT